MLKCLNSEEERIVVSILSDRRVNYAIKYYAKDFFGMHIPVCDIETNEPELEHEIFYTLYPQFD